MSEYLVTGNEYVSLPTIRQRDGAIESLSFLHMGAKGMIELCGGPDKPLIAPFAEINGLSMPEGACGGSASTAGCRSLRPNTGLQAGGDLAGADWRAGLRVQAGTQCRGRRRGIQAGRERLLAEALHSVNESKPIATEKHVYASGWNHSFVMDMRPGLSLFAFAPIFTEDRTTCGVQDWFEKRGDQVCFGLELHGRLEPGESKELCIWFGLGFEEVAASTSRRRCCARVTRPSCKRPLIGWQSESAPSVTQSWMRR